MSTIPRISFGIIVLNGEPFTKYCLRSLYPYAHEILVVEGGSVHAAAHCTPDAHSLDQTLESIREFCATEDPDQKIRLITRDGFWSEKDEQSRAYAEAATGDWLWQVDIDEFYRPEEMDTVLQLLQTRPEITTISFRSLFFWGDPSVTVNGWYFRIYGSEFHRLFRWGPGYQYATHRPPTVLDAAGRDARKGGWVRAHEMERLGVRMYHYSLLFPHQVRQKTEYYESVFGRRHGTWFDEGYMRLGHPFHVHNMTKRVSWLEPFSGDHPPEALRMLEDVQVKKTTHVFAIRPMDDAKILLANPWYARAVRFLKILTPFYAFGFRIWRLKPPWISKRLFRKLFLISAQNCSPD